ncbi:MAG: peptidoglycan-associated lipoprotein Pal [Verrucomicrobiae bacterium]|nr:peptidoglycan-associated lipoprotein Pal [Verrucomicrobiae bacterium]
MKTTTLKLLVVVLAVATIATACKRKPQPPLTYIPGISKPITNELSGFDKEGIAKMDTDKTTAVPLQPEKTTSDNVPLSNRDLIEGMIPDRDTFKANTVYFDFDRSTIKQSEKSKIDGVAKTLKSKPGTKVQIEGHCDERGTEEYNRALGERRALSVREYLINTGISADRIFTISYGEDKPVDPAHNEAAWAKNRRAEFILLLPK